MRRSTARYQTPGHTATWRPDLGTAGTYQVSLGSYFFPAGTGGFVRFTVSGAGYGRADVVKFVRVT